MRFVSEKVQKEETIVGNDDLNASDNRSGNEEGKIMAVDDGFCEGMSNFNETAEELPKMLNGKYTQEDHTTAAE